MKKIAFYVEGLTEQLFINKLLIEIANRRNIEIKLERFQGAGRIHGREIYPRTTSQPIHPQHYALILDCAGDGSVKSRILEDHQKLFSQGYSEIVGLLDLYPKPNSDLAKFEARLTNGVVRNGRVIIPALPSHTSIIIVVREIESWFLSECNHFQCIDERLNNALITSEVSFNPCADDMTTLNHPAEELHKIYQLAGKAYKKHKDQIERTVECLDYANIYVVLRNRITKLNNLISKIDAFLR
jgi:hypothetical protein